MKMKLEIDVPEERIKSLLCSAFEGGSNYWYLIVTYEYAPGLTAKDFSEGGKMQGEQYWHPCQLLPLAEGCAVILTDKEDEEKQFRLDRAAIARGIAVFREKYPKHFGDWLAEHDDADTGDVFLQCCLFGELVYG